MELLGGSAEGLSLAVDGNVASATMPLLPGDRRVLQFSGVSVSYSAWPVVTVFSECWVGTEGPHLAIALPDAF